MSSEITFTKNEDSGEWNWNDRGRPGGVGFGLTWEALEKILKEHDYAIHSDESIGSVTINSTGLHVYLTRDPQ